MTTQDISALGALASGAQLWIVASTTHSKWAQKLDWYLNFQLERMHQYEPPAWGPEISAVLDENEIKNLKLRKLEKHHVLVVSQNRLPCEVVAEIPFQPDKKEEWLKACHRLWSQLGLPTVRVFLPPPLSIDIVETHWPKTDVDKVIGVVSP